MKLLGMLSSPFPVTTTYLGSNDVIKIIKPKR